MIFEYILLYSFRCIDCFEEFQTRPLLQNHMWKYHENIKKHVCKFCDKSFEKLSKLTAHVTKVHKDEAGKSVVSCNFCELSFENIQQARRHTVKKHMDQIIYKIPTKDEIQNEKKCVHKCFTCEKVFTSRSSFNEHNKQHHSETCSKCGKIFINLEKIHLKMVLKRHERICDFMDFDPMEVDNMNCKVCGRFFNEAGELTGHFERVHTKGFCCETCGHSFGSNKELLIHVQCVHEGQRNYICDECGKAFSQGEALNVHIKKKHLLQFDYKCEICGSGFVRKGEVQRHIAKYHEKKLDYKCEYCFRGFFTPIELKQHISNTHNNENFRCEICGELVDGSDSRDNRNRLRDHIIEFHDSVRPQECDKCDRSFHLKSDLLVHYNLCHRGQKRMKCRICDQTFESRIELHKHKSSVMCKSDLKWRCKSCDAEFGTRSNLYSHVKGVHKGIKRIKW